MMSLDWPESNMISDFIRQRELDTCIHRGKTMWGHRQKEERDKPREELKGKQNHRRLDFRLSLQNCEEINLLFQPPRVWHFLKAARVNQYAQIKLIQERERLLVHTLLFLHQLLLVTVTTPALSSRSRPLPFPAAAHPPLLCPLSLV